jgi:acyl-CoA thioester hydrolase
MAKAETVSLDYFRWRTEHDLRFADQDSFGHVNNGIFGSLIETNRASLVLDNIFIEKSDFLCVAGRFEIDYINELRWPGTVLVGTTVERIGNTSITLRHGLFSRGLLSAAARSILVLISAQTRSPLAITEPQRDRALLWTQQNR